MCTSAIMALRLGTPHGKAGLSFSKKLAAYLHRVWAGGFLRI